MFQLWKVTNDLPTFLIKWCSSCSSYQEAAITKTIEGDVVSIYIYCHSANIHALYIFTIDDAISSWWIGVPLHKEERSSIGSTYTLRIYISDCDAQLYWMTHSAEVKSRDENRIFATWHLHTIDPLDVNLKSYWWMWMWMFFFSFPPFYAYIFTWYARPWYLIFKKGGAE